MPDFARGREPGITEVVELTPTGRGAVAVVLVAGPDAVRIVDECFAPASGRRLADVPLEQIAFGRLGGPGGEEVVVCRRAEEQVEVHTHGGSAAVDALIARFVDAGCRRASWPQWLRGKHHDPIRAAAQIALADAPTARTAAILLDQYHGALTNAVHAAGAALRAANWTGAIATIEAVLAHRDVGLHLTTPWHVVITGPPNVGKSSLINSLAGFQRSIVSREPGTTRDVVTTTTAIDGWPVQLADTAGVRDPKDELESAGIELAAKMLEAADLVVVVRDATQPLDHPDSETIAPVISRSAARQHIIRVWNKIDLVSAPKAERMIHTSAVTGEGIADLIAAIGSELVPLAPAPGSAVPYTGKQVAQLEAALAAAKAHDAAAGLAALQSLLDSSVLL